MHVIFLAICAPIPVVFILASLLGQLLQQLVVSTVASPQNVPPPPGSLDRAWRAVLPELYKQYTEEQWQLYNLPISPVPWYASTATAKEPPSGSDAALASTPAAEGPEGPRGAAAA